MPCSFGIYNVTKLG